MRLGLHALGIGTGARRSVIDAVAVAAERHGFATLWAGEHVVMVEHAESRYPYSPDGQIAVPADADWLDPLLCLSFAAAATGTIKVATGVLLLPEHNPVLLAKQAASLDALSGGRLILGVGVGWSREEFDALGVPFARRGARAGEYIQAMRMLWREDAASFDGEFVSFSAVRVNPKPVRDREIPVMFGGNSDGALRRVAGWDRAGTASTSRTSRRSVSGSRFCESCVGKPDGISASCGWRLRSSPATTMTCLPSPSSASMSSCSWRRRPRIRATSSRGSPS